MSTKGLVGTSLHRLPRDQKVLLVGAFCVVTLLALGKGIPALVTWRYQRLTESASIRSHFERDRRLVARRSGIRSELDHTTNAFLGLSSAFFKAKTPADGAAQLSSFVADAATENGVHMASLQPQADSARHHFVVPITVHAVGTGDIRGIAAMLSALESGAPLVEIRQLIINQPDPAATSDKMEALRVELVVRALFRAPPIGSSDGPLAQQTLR